MSHDSCRPLTTRLALCDVQLLARLVVGAGAGRTIEQGEVDLAVA